MKAVVMGSGGWGTALSQVLCDNGHETWLWSHNAAKAEEMARTRENPLLKGVILPEALHITGDLSCLEGADMVVSAAPSFAVRETARKIAPYLNRETILVSVSKGIERDTNLRMSQVIEEETHHICRVVALSGPSHAEEVGIRMPTGCVSACPDRAAARFVQDAFMNDYFRIYTSYDIVGVELAAALKNVVALSCGICTGLGFQDKVTPDIPQSVQQIQPCHSSPSFCKQMQSLFRVLWSMVLICPLVSPVLAAMSSSESKYQ